MSGYFRVEVLIHILCICALLKCTSTQNCQVNAITVQEEFDSSKYMGRWYVVGVYPDSPPRHSDITHGFAAIGPANITVYNQYRLSSPAECQAIVSALSTTSTPGKLLYTEANGGSRPYWVVSTDYTGYSLVYSCVTVAGDGTCSETRAWMLSRSETLPGDMDDTLTLFHQITCLPAQSFREVPQDNGCAIKTQWGFGGVQDCAVNGIQVQDNFDMGKYTGTWFEISWLAPKVYPASWLYNDYQHHYVINEDGNVTGYIYGRSPGEPCFYKYNILQKTDTLGKFNKYHKGSGPDPYWVLETDYTQYSVVYECKNVSSDGSCYTPMTWVWSRTPTLERRLQYHINSLLQNICVNPSALVKTPHSQPCPPNPEDNTDQPSMSVTLKSTATFVFLVAIITIIC